MNYIDNILEELLDWVYLPEDEIKKDLGKIIADHIIASSLDKQYVIDAQEYLKECEQ